MHSGGRWVIHFNYDDDNGDDGHDHDDHDDHDENDDDDNDDDDDDDMFLKKINIIIVEAPLEW